MDFVAQIYQMQADTTTTPKVNEKTEKVIEKETANDKMEDVDTETASETSVEEKPVFGPPEKPEGWVETNNEKEETEKDKMEETEKPAKPAKKRATKKNKRGHARPFAKLTPEVLASRMDKLKKRIDRSTEIHEKAMVFYTKYVRESECRASAPVEAEKPQEE